MSSVPASPDAPVRHVAIVGLGVMGGSLARALSALPAPPRVTGWSPEPSERAAALDARAVHASPASFEGAVAGADLVVLAAPLEACLDLLGPLSDAAPPDALVTDVASLKVPVQEAARRGGLQRRWVGSHPMAGSEASGFAASRRDLYRGAPVWVVADPEAGEALAAVRGVWEAVGGHVREVEAHAHDALMARVSHLPQLAANALASVLEAAGVDPSALGPGGRDTTRLAASSPAMWRDLLAHAPPELHEALHALGDEAHRLAELLERGSLEEVAETMERTLRWRSRG